jgi:DNA invertase Pin-like site-specific DNA recombinase
VRPPHGHRPDHPQNTRYAAIYCRAAVAGSSIPVQLEACRAFADQQGYTVPEGYVCLDEGYSGMSLERPSLQRLREFIQTSTIRAVIVSDLARLSRRLRHQLLLARECEHTGVTVHVVQSPGVSRLDDLQPLLRTLMRIEEREESSDEPTA